MIRVPDDKKLKYFEAFPAVRIIHDGSKKSTLMLIFLSGKQPLGKIKIQKLLDYVFVELILIRARSRY